MRRPRFFSFGLLAIFATMLLVISVAGWLRSELDLYREEQAILAGLAKAGCTTYHLRGKLDFATVHRRNQKGFAWYEPEWLTRMTDLQINGDPPQELRRRAAALPTLQSLRVFAFDPRNPPSASDPRPQAFPPSSELLGRPLPEFGEPTIDEAHLNARLPDGETLTGADRDAVLAAIKTAWSSEAPRLPPKYVKRIERDEKRYSPARVDLVRDRDRYWSVQPHFPPFDVEESLLTLRNDEAEYGLEYRDSAWRLARRGDEGIDPGWAQRMALEFSKSDLPRFGAPQLFPHMSILDQIDRIARVDEDRVRLEVKPGIFEVSPTLASDISYDIETMTLLLREDMDWAVGSERSTIAPVYSGARSSAQEIVYERTLERRQGFVVPIEELLGLPNTAPSIIVMANGETVPGPGAIEATNAYMTARTRYAWELNPDLDPTIFDPNRYLAEPLPPRTKAFPWWYVTLAVGGVLGCYLILRKIVSAFGSRQRPAVAVEPAAEG